MFKESFPVKVLLRPSEAFARIASGGTGWGWPLGLYAAAIVSSSFLLSVLPPQFITDSFEGAALPQLRGFWFYFGVSLPGGFLFTLFTGGLLSAFTGFLREGRLSLRIPLAVLGIGAFGLLAAAVHGSAPLRPAGLAAALAGTGFAVRAALRGKDRYPAALKAMFALSAVSLAGDLAGGAAALAGSVKIYAASEYFFSFLSLIWLSKAVGAVYEADNPRAANATVLAILAATAFLFLLNNLRVLPPEIFQVLLLGA